VSPGDYVATGQDLVRLVDLDVMKVDFLLPESALPLIAGAGAVVVLPDALPGERFEGEILAVEPAVTETGRA
jgi:membrane fusion protein (multidrug efflux system)